MVSEVSNEWQDTTHEIHTRAICICNIEQFLRKRVRLLEGPRRFAPSLLFDYCFGRIVISTSQTHAGHYYFIII